MSDYKEDPESSSSKIPARLEWRLARYALLAGTALAGAKSASAGIITFIPPTPINLIPGAFVQGPFPLSFLSFSQGLFGFTAIHQSVFASGGNVFSFGHGDSTSYAFRFGLGDIIPGTGSTVVVNQLLDDFTSPGTDSWASHGDRNFQRTGITVSPRSTIFSLSAMPTRATWTLQSPYSTSTPFQSRVRYLW